MLPNFNHVFELIEKNFPEGQKLNRIPTITMLRDNLKLGLVEAKNIADAHLEATEFTQWVGGKRTTPTKEEQIHLAEGFWLAKEFKNIINSANFKLTTNFKLIGLNKGLQHS